MGQVLLVLLVISSLAVIACAWKIFNYIWLTPKKLEKYFRDQGISGPPYKLLTGNLKELGSMMMEAKSKPMELSHRIVPRVNPFTLQTVQKHGKISLEWYGPTLRVNITDPDHIGEVLSNKHGHIFRAQSTPFLKLLVTGLISYDGDKWVKHRKLINPAFHLEKLKIMLPAFYTSCSELVSKWQNLVSKESCELDVWPEFQKLTSDVISRSAFGVSYVQGLRINQLESELAELLVQSSIQAPYIPGISWYLPTKTNNRMKEIEAEVRTLLTNLIKQREEAMEIGEVRVNDLLGLLLESNMKEIEDNGNSKSKGMSIDEVIDECKLFYLAGQETIATLLVWTTIVLSMHPEWQVKAREEVFEVFGKSKPDFEGLNRLKIVTMILYEVLRLYPPVTILTRATNKKVKLGEVYIPPGVEIGLQALLVHHDNEFWGDDAEEFNPERFSEGISKATKHQFSFIPFGGGPRVCIGQTFALLEAKMGLSMILQNFSFDLSPTYIHAPFSVTTLRPQHGSQVILHKL